MRSTVGDLQQAARLCTHAHMKEYTHTYTSITLILCENVLEMFSLGWWAANYKNTHNPYTTQSVAVLTISPSVSHGTVL